MLVGNTYIVWFETNGLSFFLSTLSLPTPGIVKCALRYSGQKHLLTRPEEAENETDAQQYEEWYTSFDL